MNRQDQSRVIAEIDLHGASEQELACIEGEAQKHGISFEEASKRLLLEHFRASKRNPIAVTVAQLFRRQSVH
ncbi:hypothetical protein [Pseudorhodoferax sp. Leaf274]|uniref:hypothetical protein n=1 Tax=Pseudorhodoferax sp. Leaf274 TaxID=1736318 RepID=UPI0012E2EFB0|nr:hypothetical protein [Pseudorhodoferax sp. Leaf274]